MKKIILSIAITSLLLSCKGNSENKDTDQETEKEQTVTTEESKEEPQEKLQQKVEDAVKNVEEVPSGIKVKVTEKQLESTVLDFQNCKSASEKRSDCRNKITSFIGKVYKVNEFKDNDQNYVMYDSIQPIILRSQLWSTLGSATEQGAIDKALEHANNGGLAVIIDTSQSYGQLVVVQAGEAKKSGSWGLKLPNVLLLANHSPSKSFYNKSMAYAFKKSEDLQVYIRK